MSSGVSHMAQWLVRHRIALFVAMSLIAVACGLLVPHVHINTDMTAYLPDDSPMKQGLDLLETQLPAMQEELHNYGGVFSDGNDLMPTDLPRTLALGVSLLFLVLLIMSSSVGEVLLFLVTVGYAVVINMGSNALLPSVSMITNTLTAVLQMVLSMDYSIILMNRYRQEKNLGKMPQEAMELAIDSGSRSILSSAFTTVVSLLMLCFIKLKIGADLGLVLAKGVSFSLLANFTVLPTLIIWGDHLVEKTKKKVPVLPATPLARFLYRFRWVAAALFLVIFVGFAILKQQTVLSFSPQWESTASEEHQNDDNALMLLYATAEETAIPVLLDSAARDPLVHRVVSYPSLALTPLTVSELRSMATALAGDTAPDIPEDLLQLVYYAHSHPQREERLSFQELQVLVEEFSAKGLVPEEMNPSRMMRKLAAQAAPVTPAKEAVPAPEAPSPEPAPAANIPADSLELTPAIPDSTVIAEPIPAPEAPQSRFTYKQATTPLPAEGMAALLGQNPGQVRMIYRLAGKQKGTLTPPEFIQAVKTKVLGKRQYAAMVPKGTAEQLEEVEAELKIALAAGPSPLPAPTELPAKADTTAAPDSVFVAPEPKEEPVVLAATPPEPPETAAPTPQEELLDMALSGERFTAPRIHRALTRAGIAVSEDPLDLLFLYAGAQKDFDTTTAIAPITLLNYVADTLLTMPALATFVPDSTRQMVIEARGQLLSGVEMLRGADYSAAVVLTGYEVESDRTFSFVQQMRDLADRRLSQKHYWVGESQMYKELKDGFPRELLLLTVLTVLSIFLIVAFTFKSILLPIPLVMTILAGVYANIWASGLGGHTLYYLSYLIIQGILMGATIDYSILFTSYFLRERRTAGVQEALAAAYKGSSHSILTSGLILVIVPYVMSITMADKMIASILSSLAIGAFAVLVLILFVLPGVLAALNPGRRNL